MSLLGFAIGRSITRPILAAVSVAQRVAAGDMTVRVRSGGSGERSPTSSA